MLIMREMVDFDTLGFCNTLNITKAEFDDRIKDIKNKRKNPGYSRYTPQVFMSQISTASYGLLQEKMFRFPGVLTQQRVLRKYSMPHGAHALGSVGEVSQKQIDEDSYYVRGDYKGQSGVEKTYYFVMFMDVLRANTWTVPRILTLFLERILPWDLIWNSRDMVNSL